MEIFVDGGLFELIALLIFGYGMNYILRRKLLLIAYCIIALASPFGVIFLHEGFIRECLAVVSVVNAGILVFILVSRYKENKDQPLFDVSSYYKKLPSFIRKKIKNKL